MKKEPNYLIKFTNAYNDNGTVWYTINVILTELRFLMQNKNKIGHLSSDSAE
jgi:hypothetical protein